MPQPTLGRNDVVSGTDFSLCAVCHVTSKDPQAKACATVLRRFGAISTSGVPTVFGPGFSQQMSGVTTTLITLVFAISLLVARVAEARPAAAAKMLHSGDAAVTGAQRACGAVTIAAAADLNDAMSELIAQFEKASGCSTRLSTGSSGNFFSQIENGAPFDVFFSADVEYPRKLEAEGLAVPGSVFVYGTGKIVLWVRNESRLDLSKGLTALRDPSVRKVAIANPQHAPYGRAAEEALRKSGVYDVVKDRLVLGENISQAAQFVESGNADAGILALSLAVSPGLKEEGRYAKIPENLYAPIEQGAALLRNSPNPQAARAFLEFVKTPSAAAVLERYGFKVPGLKDKEEKKP
jgi:molybdate transport system substrate-binding protein